MKRGIFTNCCYVCLKGLHGEYNQSTTFVDRSSGNASYYTAVYYTHPDCAPVMRAILMLSGRRNIGEIKPHKVPHG